MPRYLHIQIPEACHEKWENMKPGHQGNYCHSCQKTVVDFSAMTDEQMLAFFKKKPANVCGRFNELQLAAPIPAPTKKIPWLKYFFQITLPVFLFGQDSKAQSTPRKKTVQTFHNTHTNPVCANNLSCEAKSIRISGTVTSVKGEPVSFASIVIKGNTQGTEADSLGRFSLLIEQDIQWLEISAVGYKTIEVDLFTQDKTQPLHFELESKEMLSDVVITSDINYKRTSIMMGGVGYAYTTHLMNAAPLMKTPAETQRLTVFPNPASINEIVTIRFETPVTHDQELALYHTNGALLRRMSINAKQALTQIQLRMQVPSAGNYFISITDQQTKKKEIVQIVVR